MGRIQGAAWLATVCAGLLSAHGAQQAVAPNAADFNAQRAQTDLKALVRGPRPLGSPEAARARAFVMGRLREAGLAPKQECAFVCTPLGACGRACNVVARIEGGSNKAPLVLSAHLDTVASSPGAHDDALGVVILLEIARLLAEHPQPGRYSPRPVVLLFDDGEEVGLLGARAFAEAHPDWAQGAFVFATVDGMAGPTVLRTQGPADMSLMWSLGQLPRPRASSLERAWHQGGGYDASQVFAHLGVPAVTIAGDQGYELYHNARDDLSALTTATLLDRGEATWRFVQASFRDRHRHVSDGAYGHSFALALWSGLSPTWVVVALAAILLLGAAHESRVRLKGGLLLLALLCGVAMSKLLLVYACGPAPAAYSLLATTLLLWAAAGMAATRGPDLDPQCAIWTLALGALTVCIIWPQAAATLVLPVAGMAVVQAACRAVGALTWRPLQAAAPQLGLTIAAILLADQAVSAAAVLPAGAGLVGSIRGILPEMVCVVALGPLVWGARVALGATPRAALWPVGVCLALSGALQFGAPRAPEADVSTLRHIDDGPGRRRLMVRGRVLPGYGADLRFETVAQVYPWSSGGYPRPVAAISTPAGPMPEVEATWPDGAAARWVITATTGTARLRFALAPDAPEGDIWVQGRRVPLSPGATQWTHGWRLITVHGDEPVQIELRPSGASAPIRYRVAAVRSGLVPEVQRRADARPPGVQPYGFGDATERGLEAVVGPGMKGLDDSVPPAPNAPLQRP